MIIDSGQSTTNRFRTKGQQAESIIKNRAITRWAYSTTLLLKLRWKDKKKRPKEINISKYEVSCRLSQAQCRKTLEMDMGSSHKWRHRSISRHYCSWAYTHKKIKKKSHYNITVRIGQTFTVNRMVNDILLQASRLPWPGLLSVGEQSWAYFKCYGPMACHNTSITGCLA